MTWFGICILSLLIAGGLFLSGFFSGAETGLYRINRLRLHLDSKRSDPRALRLSQVLSDEQGALSAAQAVDTKHHSAYHRVFSTARWSLDELGLAVLELILPWVDQGAIPLALADTLARIPDYKITKVDDLLPWKWNG